jgi:large subunit ribosomal protein L24
MKIKTGDKVKITAGKEKGKEGKVIQIFPNDDKVVIEGINLATRHLRSRQRGQAGQKIQFPAPLHVSNVQLISGKTSKSGRVGYKFLEQDNTKKKVRVIRQKGKSEDVE